MAIENAAFDADAWPRRDFWDIARSEEAVFLVAEAADEIAGYCIGVAMADEGYIASIAVGGAHQRKGLGRMLMQALIDALREQGAEAIALHVRISNAAAISLYRAFGFEIRQEIDSYYMDGEASYFMIREG